MPVSLKFLLVYAVVGMVLSAAYTFLAAGTEMNFVVTMWLGPILLACLTLFWSFECKRRNRYSQPAKRYRRYLGTKRSWLAACYLCLPIILNGVSLVIGKAGYVETAERIFHFRYLSLVLVGAPAACWIGYALYKKLRALHIPTISPPRA